MKKFILLLMCLCFVGCAAQRDTDGTTVSETTTVTTTAKADVSAAETTAVSETTAAATTTTTAGEATTTLGADAFTTIARPEISTVETTTVPETTAVVTTTTEETTTVPETTKVTKNSTEKITTAPETSKVTKTSKKKTTTVPETATAEITSEEITEITTEETTETTTEITTVTEAVPEDYTVIEIEGKKYRLTFEDEFEGNRLDEKKWEKCPEWPRQDLNNFWDDDMSYLDGDGNLIIEMSYDKAQDKYLSGGVRSKGKFEQAYGYFEIRCTVNTVPGYWTAFWLMGESVVDETKGGVNGTEIDIMESAYFDEKIIQNSLNWDGYGVNHKVDYKKAPADVYDGEYHTFSLLWTEDEYVYYIDGVESWRTKAEEALGVCEVPLYLKITSEMGSWTKNVLIPENLPDYMKVDYVRVYAEK